MPDVTYHLIRNVAEGDRGALAYEVNGKVTHADKTEDGKPMDSNIEDVKQGVHFQFDEKGKIINAVVVYNSEDFNKQLK